MPEPSEYLVDRLLLLIGENPLPSYIAARTLLKSGGTPYLVYSSHTQEPADRIRDLLKERSPDLKPCKFITLSDYESDSYHIRTKIQEVMKLHNQERWGLNYTGGTKPMATHAYRALFELQPDAVFSYLDPRRLEMCIDREDGDRIRQRTKLEIPLSDLFELHSLLWQSPPTTQAWLPDAAHAMAKLHQDKTLAACWRNWCDSTLRKSTKKGSGWLSDRELQSCELPLTYLENSENRDLPDQIKSVLQKYFDANANVLLLQSAKERGKFEKYKHLCEWLDGTWLEHHTLQQVQSIARDYHIHDSGLSFAIKNPQTRQDKFELDVAFIRSYQLFAISCTTDDSQGLCKLKLFEAYLRARQLGGDEARVALVCCSDKPDALKHQLDVILENPKIKVFGREHLSNLAGEIAAWIDQNDREAT
jgi:hypothetical protein